MSGFNNTSWNGPTSSGGNSAVVRQARPAPMAKLSEDMEGKQFTVKIFVARSSVRTQQAFGSLTIDTEIGPLTMNGLTVRKNISKNVESTQLPFKAYPNKHEGGYWNVISNEFGEVWQTVGPVNYTKFFDNTAAGVAAKLFYEAFRLCSTCNNCRDLEKSVVDRMVNRIAELNSKPAAELTKQESSELEKLSNQLATLNKSCYLDPDEDEVRWSTVKEADEVNISCSHYNKYKISDSNANVSAASKLFNMSAEVKETEDESTEEELF